MHNSVIIGERLRKSRELRGLTIQQLSADLNIKPNTYSNYETGNRYPRADFLMELCVYLDVEPNYIFGASEYPYTFCDKSTAEEEIRERMNVERAMETIQHYVSRRPKR